MVLMRTVFGGDVDDGDAGVLDDCDIGFWMRTEPDIYALSLSAQHVPFHAAWSLAYHEGSVSVGAANHSLAWRQSVALSAAWNKLGQESNRSSDRDDVTTLAQICLIIGRQGGYRIDSG